MRKICRTITLTCGIDEGRVELLREERVGHVPEELLEKGGHVMNAVVLVQLHVHAAIKLVTQLKENGSRGKGEQKGKGRFRNILCSQQWAE